MQRAFRLEYPAHVTTIGLYLDRRGYSYLEPHRIDVLWRCFSKDFAATFLSPDQDWLERFYRWLHDEPALQSLESQPSASPRDGAQGGKV